MLTCLHLLGSPLWHKPNPALLATSLAVAHLWLLQASQQCKQIGLKEKSFLNTSSAFINAPTSEQGEGDFLWEDMRKADVREITWVPSERGMAGGLTDPWPFSNTTQKSAQNGPTERQAARPTPEGQCSVQSPSSTLKLLRAKHHSSRTCGAVQASHSAQPKDFLHSDSHQMQAVSQA